MGFKSISEQKIWELLHPKEAREVDRVNAQAAARERKKSDRAKQTARLAHPDAADKDTPEE